MNDTLLSGLMTTMWALVALAGWFLVGSGNPVGFIMAIAGMLLTMMGVIVIAADILKMLGEWFGLNRY
jgi:hypothetical protein